MRGLFRRDYELFLANEGKEALRLAAENDIDVIVADQRMPGMTGIEVLARIKQQSPRTVRILLTGYADPNAIEGSINIGEVFRFLSKPCPPKTLRETLGLAIEASKTVPAAKPQTATEDKPLQRTPNRSAQDNKRVEVKPVVPSRHEPQTDNNIAANADSGARPAVVPTLTKPVSQPIQKAPPQTRPQALTPENRPVAEPSHWETVTNIVMTEDRSSESQEQLAFPAANIDAGHVGVVVFTIDSDFAATAIRATSKDRSTQIATTLAKVASVIKEREAGVLVTDFTSSKSILQKIISALKQRMPELVTIVIAESRDSEDMINLINHGQIYRYIVKPVDAMELRMAISAAAVKHLFLSSNPESARRHTVSLQSDTSMTSGTLQRLFEPPASPSAKAIDLGENGE